MKIDVTRSGLLRSIEYKESSNELIIEFIKGGLYLYKDVPETVFKDLIGAESIGKYFLTKIKGKFETEKL